MQYFLLYIYECIIASVFFRRFCGKSMYTNPLEARTPQKLRRKTCTNWYRYTFETKGIYLLLQLFHTILLWPENVRIKLSSGFVLLGIKELSKLVNLRLWQCFHLHFDILEQRQCNNDSIQSKIIPSLKLPHFFPYRLGGEKARQIQIWNYFWLN